MASIVSELNRYSFGSHFLLAYNFQLPRLAHSGPFHPYAFPSDFIHSYFALSNSACIGPFVVSDERALAVPAYLFSHV